MKDVELYHGDCYEILPQLIKQGVKTDCIITDLPYIVNSHGGAAGKFGKRALKVRKEISFMSDGIDYEALFPLFRKICPIANYIIFCSNLQVNDFGYYFTHTLNLTCENLVWRKTNAMPIANNHYHPNVEYILYVKEKTTFINNDLPLNMKSKVKDFAFVNPQERVHPTQKPIGLMDNFTLFHTKENDTILDCFMGSGTTGISAVKNNRNFIGIEKEKKYFDIAQQRIDAENRQTSLLDFC